MPLDKTIIEWNTEQMESNIRVSGPDYWTINSIVEDGKKGIENIQRLRKDQNRGAIWANFHSFASRAFGYGVSKRILEDKPQYLLDGIYTFGRLRYLADVLSPDHHEFPWSGPMAILAGKDQKVIQAYVKNFLPLVKGPLTHRILDHGLYGILQNDSTIRTRLKMLLEEAESNKSVTAYNKHIGLAYQGIIELDEGKLLEGLQYIADKSWQLRDSLPIESITLKGIPLYAHALCNLARDIFKKNNLQLSSRPNHRFWDADYDEWIASSDAEPSYLFDYSKISPKLAQLMDELPQAIDLFSL